MNGNFDASKWRTGEIELVRTRFGQRRDGGIFFFLKGPRFVRVIVIQGEFGLKQLDGTAGREKNVQQIKQRILEHLPQDHPQRRRIDKGSGGVHRKRDKRRLAKTRETAPWRGYVQVLQAPSDEIAGFRSLSHSQRLGFDKANGAVCGASLAGKSLRNEGNTT